MVLVGESPIIEEYLFIGSKCHAGIDRESTSSIYSGCPTIILACGIRTIFHDDGGAYVLDDIDELPFFIKEIERGNTPDPEELKKWGIQAIQYVSQSGESEDQIIAPTGKKLKIIMKPLVADEESEEY